MKVKRMVKRLFAVSAGAAMLGATAMGAMAADLNEYPDMFVTDGVFNGVFVVGAAAQAIDNLAMTDIATSMYVAGSGSGTTTTVSGDAWMVESGSDVLEFSESFGPSTHGVVDFLDDSDLNALADAELSNSKGTFAYEQFLYFDNAVINTTYAEDDEDLTDLFLKVPDNTLFARYELNFLEAAKSDVDTSENDQLDDFEDKRITMFGKSYNIVKAVSGSDLITESVTLTLMAGSVSEALQEGETATYNIGGKDYEVALTFTDSSNRAKFTVNGESTPLMDEGDTETLSDGTVLGLSKVLYQDYAGGIHRADFFLGADKLELKDTNITAGGSSNELSFNDETIDGADVEITGAVLTEHTSSADGELEIDKIVVNMTSQDDYYIGAGETLSGQAEVEEKGLLFGDWDIRFDGMNSGVGTDMIKLSDSAAEAEYEVTFTNIKGDTASLPFTYSASGTNLRLGDKNDNLTLSRLDIHDEQYFILNDDTDQDSVTHIVQYKGADDQSKSDPRVDFRILTTGETVKRPITFAKTRASATLQLSGTTYTIQNSTTGTLGGTATKDWGIEVTGGSETNSSGVYGAATDSVTYYNKNYLIGMGGAKIELTQLYTNTSVGSSWRGQYPSGSGNVSMNVSLIDSDMIDDRATAPYMVANATVTASGGEVDLTNVAGGTAVAFASPDDDDDNSYAWSINGAWIKHNSPSGSGTTADNLEIEWPQQLRSVMAYVTSGAVTTGKKRTGNLQQVQVVDATKLDSEVSSVTAQNIISVGGPCVNTVSAELMGNPSDCTAGFTPGRAKIKLYENGGNVAMVVAGFSGADTRLAGKVIAHRAADLSGMEVEIEGTTYSDATIGAPSNGQ